MTAAHILDRPLLDVQDVGIQFRIGRRQVLRAVDGVSLSVRRGETFGIIGESGCGKTTLGRALVCLERPTTGRILHNGVDPYSLTAKALRQHRSQYQIVFQDPNAALDPRMTILRSVREPLDAAGTLPTAQRRDVARGMMERVGLGVNFADRYPHELSGGQKQRVCIARVLTLRPAVIVCDEAVSALDVSIQADILNLLADLQAELALTYVFITHNLSVVAHISDRIAVMYLGGLVELGDTEALLARPMHPYTQALLSAEPIALPSHMRDNRRILLSGDLPSPVSPPSGCRFRTRCRFAATICAEQPPPWRETAPQHWAACHFAGSVTSLHTDAPRMGT
jgi:oligopeptide/dipeptide ABC transporter ATP-binding protein